MEVKNVAKEEKKEIDGFEITRTPKNEDIIPKVAKWKLIDVLEEINETLKTIAKNIGENKQ